MPILDHAGGAVATTITGAITSSSTTITLADASGWPSGGANGEFYATLNRGLSSEERILIQSRSGNTLTLASAAKRGVDGTAAASHDAGSSIDHGLSAAEIDEVNAHAFDTTRDDHTQYHNTARHAAVSHTQAMLASDSVGSAQIQANAVGSSELANDAVDTAAIQALAVTAAKIANDTITATQLAADSVGASELANVSVDTANLIDGAIENGSKIETGQALSYVSASDPGAVGNGMLWFDTTNRAIKVRNAANSGWDIFGLLQTEWAAYTPTLSNVTLGAGGTQSSRWVRIGHTVVITGEFLLGTGGNVSGEIIISLPSGADVAPGTIGLAGAQALDASPAARWASVGLVDPDEGPVGIRRFGTAGVSWQSTVPFTWTNGDIMRWFAVYETDE